jgi:phosphoribosylamine--glycine ligase
MTKGDRLRVLGIGPRAYLGDMYLAMQRGGCEVRVFASDPPESRAFGGIIDFVPDWRAELDWVGRDGVIMFEGVASGALQDQLRRDGHRVVGGGEYGDRLERDREFGQAALRDIGLPVAESLAFDDAARARGWLAANPGRYVLKHDDGARATFVGEHPAGADVDFMLSRAGPGRLLLMERVSGVEVGIGAYFDGRRFLRPACIDFEHKRFFPGELGEMTGEMGTLAAFDGSGPLFEATLGRMEPSFSAVGHVGYVNLNLIVNEQGVWPLEFTCRFGNPGFAVLAALQTAGWGDLLGRMAFGGSTSFPTAPGWSVAIVLTIPPFPAWNDGAAAEDDPPVFFHAPPEGAEWDSHHLVDVRREEGQLLAHRRSGHVMIVTGAGASVQDAQRAAAARAKNVIVPELRWRGDIGDRFLAGEGDRLRALGWLD